MIIFNDLQMHDEARSYNLGSMPNPKTYSYLFFSNVMTINVKIE